MREKRFMDGGRDCKEKIGGLSRRRQVSSSEKRKNYILMGLGNIWRGDDGVGCFIAQNFKSDDWLVLDCGTVPENFTSVVSKSRPKYLVIVDAAQMHLEPGQFRVIPPERIDQLYITTHNIPLSYLISYLDRWVEKIILIGIQPKKIDDFNWISKELKDSTKKIIRILEKKRFQSLKGLK
jgi:hydrogenase 3 maturation protease